MAGVKIASNVFSYVLDHSCELNYVLVVEKFGRDMVQSSHELRMSVSSESSAEIRWSIVGMLQPVATLICCPDFIVIGESVFVLGQTWLVAMVPME